MPTDYRTIEVPAGGHERLSVGSGETLENILIDMTATGASASIYASGADWTIRNIGIKGRHPGGHYIFKPSTDGRDAHGVIENLYAADGQEAGTGKGFCWVNHNSGNDGKITFRNVNLQGFVDNAIYGSSSAHPDNSGVVNVEDSVLAGNNISNYRAGTTDGRTPRVSNTRIGPHDHTPPCGVGCSSPGAVNPRAIWAWYGTVVAEDCEITGAIAEHEGGTVELRNSNTGTDADMSWTPAGVPTTAEQAASGGGSDGSAGSGSGSGSGSDGASTPTGTRFNLVTGEGAPLASYTFTARGTVAKATDHEPKADNNDDIADNGDGTVTVTGEAGNGYGDGYYVDGTVEDINVDTNVWTLSWDGSEVSPADLPFGGTDDGADTGTGDGTDDGDSGTDTGGGGDADAPPERTVVLQSPGKRDAQSDLYEYRFEVDEVVSARNLEPHERESKTDDGHTVYDGEMYAGGHVDAYIIRGHCYAFEATDGLIITEEGTETTPGDLVTVGGGDGGSGNDGGSGDGSTGGYGEGARWSETVEQSGGGQTTFTIPHGLATAPGAVSVEPASEGASTDYWVTAQTADAIELTYSRQKRDSTTMAWHVTVWE